MKLIYLPPYSPDLNPIEAAFGCTKAWIRRNNVSVRAAMCDEDPEVGLLMIEKAVHESITPEKAVGWFRDCGYF
jgi:transposase